MNIQKLYEALEGDEMNSALGTICAEFERQGYAVRINDKKVSSDEFFDGKEEGLENEFLPLKISLHVGEILEQAFVIEFTEYHDFVIKKSKSTSRPI